MQTLLQKDYVLLSLDSGKHKNAEAVIKKLRTGHKGGGIPWMTVLDENGKERITSDGERGNIGCPIQPHEIAWFRTMLERTKSKLSEADLDTIQKANEAYAHQVLQKPKKTAVDR